MTAWFDIALAASVQFAAVVALAFLADRTLLRRAAPRTRVALWAAVLLPLAVPLRPQVGVLSLPQRAVEVPSQANQPDMVVAAGAATSTAAPRTTTRRVEEAARRPSRPPESSESSEGPKSAERPVTHTPRAMPSRAVASEPISAPLPPAEPLPWREGLALLWIVGVALLLGRALLAELRMRRILDAALPADDRVRRLTAEAARIAGLREVPAALRCDALASPAVHGVRRPRFLVPTSALELEDDELRAVLVHEAFHVRRHDLVWAPLVVVLRALWWFHPLVPFASRSLADALEEARDHDALIALGVLDASAPSPHSPARLAYARVLVRLAEARAGTSNAAHLSHPSPALAPGVIPLTRDGRGLTRRVAMILTSPPSHRFAAFGGVSLAAGIVGLGLVRAGTSPDPNPAGTQAHGASSIAVERPAPPPAWRAEVDAKLAQRAGGVSIESTDLVEAFHAVGEQFGLQMRVDTEAIHDNGYEAAQIAVSGLSCAELLDLLCLNGDDLAWSVSGGTVHIGERGDLPSEIDLRFYRVAPVLEARGIEDEDDLITFVLDFGSAAHAGHRLPDSWEMEGTYVQMWRGLLAVRATEETHRSVERVLNRALVVQERPAEPAPPWRESIETGLDQRIDLEWDSVECGAALEELAAIVGAPILHPSGHPDDDGNLFSYRVKDTPLRTVLGWIASEQNRHVQVADGAVLITEGLQLEMRLHSITALLALSGGSPNDLVDEVTEFIMGVGPETWDEDPNCQVIRFGDVLVIRQTARNHDEIAALLAQMERALGG